MGLSKIRVFHMFKCNQIAALATAATMTIGVASHASAATVSVNGDSFTSEYNTTFDAANSLIASLTWTLDVIAPVVGGTKWDFSVLVENNSTSTEVGAKNSITSLGFTTDPAARDLVVSTADWDGTTSGPIAAGYQSFNIDACVFNGSNCQGGQPNDGVKMGESLVLAFSFITDTVDPLNLSFESFGLRFQGIGDADGSMVIAPIPVPAAGFLLLGALGGLAFLRRRQQKMA